MINAILPIHELVYAATDGAALGTALEALPLEELDQTGADHFLQSAGVVFGALVHVHRPTALEFREWARILRETVGGGNKEAAGTAKRQMAALFGELNGTWALFKQHFDDRVARLNLFAPVAVATARAQEALSGSIAARPAPLPPQVEPLPLEQRQVLYMRRKLSQKYPRFVSNYEHL